MENHKLHIAGVHLKDEGYPNVLYKIKDLQESDLYRICEYNQPMWDKSARARLGVLNKFKGLMRAFYSHLSVLIYVFRYASKEVVYIPYPGVFLAYVISFFPKNRKPKAIVLDAFISLYDTVVCDRQLLQASNLLAKLLKHIESQAYREVTKVITDTPQNVSYMSELFSMPPEQFVSIPLSSNEKHFSRIPFKGKAESYNILFIGTLVPLHGIEVILEAAEILSNHDDVQFTLIGNGQTADFVENHIKNAGSNTHWEKEWKTSEELAEYIESADVCLGIFGKGAKTQRVCPFKLYAYSVAGKPIITGETTWSRECKTTLNYEPFVDIESSGQSLATTIEELLDDEMMRKTLADNSAQFYEEMLSNKKSMDQFVDLIDPYFSSA